MLGFYSNTKMYMWRNKRTALAALGLTCLVLSLLRKFSCQVSSDGDVIEYHKEISDCHEQDNTHYDDKRKFTCWRFFVGIIISKDPDDSIMCHVQRVRYAAGEGANLSPLS